ncbi:MAG: 8-oxo-dGTP diphosphatase MutT [Verrucomicrobia bacterium]|jgi:mutator protein MutT|nr:8-oxo-dGTP diphosphatase MutT [Verrucomicrobiota bacterium]
MESGTHPSGPHPQSPDTPIIDVAAGLLFRNGRLLIAQRHPDSHLGGLWEFPGGKREPGETFEAALARELREELAVSVSVGERIETIEHDYPDKRVRICFFRCHLEQGEPRAVDCHDLRWIRRDELNRQPFPAADASLLDRLAAEDGLWTP